MPVATPALLSFAGGELSALMAGRTDHKRYYNSAETMENFLALPQGPAARRGGLRFVVEAADSASRGNLFPFVFNTEQAYQLEAGAGRLRFLKDKGQIVVPATAASVTDGDMTALTTWNASSVTAVAGRAVFASGGTIDQDLGPATANVQHVIVFEVFGCPGRDSVVMRLGATLGASDIRADEIFGPGRHAREFTPATTALFIQFEQETGEPEVDNVDLLDGEPLELPAPWTAAQIAPPPANVNDAGGGAGLQFVQSADVWFADHPELWPMQLSRTGHASWSLEPVDFQDGPYLPENATATTLDPVAATVGDTQMVASSTEGINDGQGFLATDVGRVVALNHGTTWGWARIYEVTDPLTIQVHVRFAFTANTAVTKWRLGLWSDTTGWPRAITFHEERLVHGGAAARPQRLDGSKIGDFFVFTPGTTDADAFAYNIGSNQVNTILSLASAGALLVQTPGGVFAARTGASDAPITPTNVQVKLQTAWGANGVQPLVLDKLVYVHRQGKKAFDLDYSLDRDRFTPTELTLVADHVTSDGIVAWAWQQEPFGCIWAVTDDGRLIACTYLPEQEVTGWHRHPVGGSFAGGAAVVEAVSVIPGAGEDEVWAIVKRTINGATKRYIEVLEAPLPLAGRQDESFYVDSGLSFENAQAVTLTPGAVSGNSVVFNAGGSVFAAGDVGREIHHDWTARTEDANGVVTETPRKARALIAAYTSATRVTANILAGFEFPNTSAGVPEVLAGADWRMTVTQVSGLGHLEGQTIALLSDGANCARVAVAAGVAQLSTPGSRVHAGLRYVSVLRTMPIEAGQQEGAANVKLQGISRVFTRFLRSVGGLLGRPASDATPARLEPITSRLADDATDTPEPLFTGVKKTDFPRDWARGAQVEHVQHLPLPMTVVSAVPKVGTSG